MKKLISFATPTIALLLTMEPSLALAECPKLDRAQVMTRIREASRIDAAMQIRKSYEPKLCSLENLEIVSDLELEGEWESFPAYQVAIADFLVDQLKRQPKDSLSQPGALATLKTILKRVFGVNRIIVRYLIAPWARNCGELVSVIEAAGAEPNERGQAIEAFREHQDQAGCSIIRY